MLKSREEAEYQQAKAVLALKREAKENMEKSGARSRFIDRDIARAEARVDIAFAKLFKK